MKQLKRGILIAIEGIDGSGKTLLTQNLALRLQDKFRLLVTREPGGSKLGQLLRTVLHEKSTAICPKAEYLLFAADRAQHFEEVIIPALAKNMLVISDRLSDSSIVYQGYGRGLDRTMIQTINQWAMNNREPDIILYVRVDAATAYERLHKRAKPLTSFEQESRSFFQRLCAGFDELFASKSNVIILDGLQMPETITSHAVEYLMQWIQTNGYEQK
jgi:dTMP kinase